MPRPHKIQIVERKVPRTGKKDRILYYARVTYSINGKRKAIWRAGVTKTEARDRLKEALKERESLTIGGRFHPQTKFAVLLDWYLKNYATDPTYRDERKISGLRSSSTIKTNAKPLTACFADVPIGRIGHTDLESYKKERLRTPTVRDNGVRSIASVNRELALARRVFGIAEREGWIVRSPFKGDSLISQADERRGTRVLSAEEEIRLLAACTGKRKHLRRIIICALETGMRRGEVLSLRWQDVYLERRRITLYALNTKRLRSRTLVIPRRLLGELTWLYEHRDEKQEPRVFGYSEVKRSMGAACKEAKLERGSDGVSFRCLRRTCATRWRQAGIPGDVVSKMLGHSTGPKEYGGVAQVTYQHYLSIDETTLAQVEEILNRVNQLSESSHQSIGSR